MTPKITIDDQTLTQLQQVGELCVHNSSGIPLVVMTVAAREHLQRLIYDDRELSEVELMTAGAEQLNDPDGWGAPGMDVYDTMEGSAPTENGRS